MNDVLPARLPDPVSVDVAHHRTRVDPQARIKVRVVKAQLLPTWPRRTYFALDLGPIGLFPIGTIEETTIPQVVAWAKYHGPKLLETVMEHWPLATKVIQ
jgi:hypothetical protein